MKGCKLIEKTDGNGETIQVWEKLEVNEDGRYVKRRKPTNVTPKKKKRKK